MSNSKEAKEKDILLRLIEIEGEKNRGSAEHQLSAEDTAKLINRIRAARKQLADESDQQEKNSPGRSVVNWKKWLTAMAAVLLLGIGISRLFNAFTSPKEKVLSEIAFASGEVQLFTGTETQPVTLGAPLPFNAVLSTGTNASAVAAWSTPNATAIISVALGQGASLQAGLLSTDDGLLAMKITQTKGRIAYAVKPGRAKLHIETPAANIDVVGTGFLVGVSPEGTTIMVSSGSVEVKPGAEFLRDNTAKIKAFSVRRVRALEKVHVRPNDEALTVIRMTDADSTALNAFEALTSLTSTQAAENHNRDQALGTKLIEAEAKWNTERGALAKPGFEARGAHAARVKMSIVTTKSGKSYTGFYSHKGDYAEIRTASGTEKIPVDEIQDVKDKE